MNGNTPVKELVAQSPQVAEAVFEFGLKSGDMSLLSSVAQSVQYDRSGRKTINDLKWVRFAISTGRVEILDFVLDFMGKDFVTVHKQNEDFDFRYAAFRSKSFEMVMKLKEYGVNPCGYRDETVRGKTVKLNSLQKLVLGQVKNDEVRQEPDLEGYRLWKRFSSLDERHGSGPTALLIAVMYEADEHIEALLSEGASPSVMCSFAGERTTPFERSWSRGCSSSSSLAKKMATKERSRVLLRARKTDEEDATKLEHFFLELGRSESAPVMRNRKVM